jgi:hypothetical protein
MNKKNLFVGITCVQTEDPPPYFIHMDPRRVSTLITKGFSVKKQSFLLGPRPLAVASDNLSACYIVYAQVVTCLVLLLRELHCCTLLTAHLYRLHGISFRYIPLALGSRRLRESCSH